MNDNYRDDEFDRQYIEDGEAIEFKDIGRKKKVRKKKHYLLRILIFAGIIAGVCLFLSSGIFTVKEIAVEGNHYYNDEQVINMGGAKTGVNIFLGADKSSVKDKLLENPYFSNAEVHRKLPGKLIIKVEERTQIAAFTYGDTFVIVDTAGTVLRKSDVDPKLTLLTGLTISKLAVGETIEAEEKTALDSTLNMLETMQDGDIFFKKIDVSKVIIKAYILDTLIVKGTPKQMKKAIESGDLQKVVNNLLKNKTIRGTINLGEHNYMSFSPEF